MFDGIVVTKRCADLSRALKYNADILLVSDSGESVQIPLTNTTGSSIIVASRLSNKLSENYDVPHGLDIIDGEFTLVGDKSDFVERSVNLYRASIKVGEKNSLFQTKINAEDSTIEIAEGLKVALGGDMLIKGEDRFVKDDVIEKRKESKLNIRNGATLQVPSGQKLVFTFSNQKVASLPNEFPNVMNWESVEFDEFKLQVSGLVYNKCTMCGAIKGTTAGDEKCSEMNNHYWGQNEIIISAVDPKPENWTEKYSHDGVFSYIRS